jgi:hypothetical protein
VLAGRGDARQACEHPDAVAALADCTPVTKSTGRHRGVAFRCACNKRFRVAITTFADNSRHASPWAARIYDDARARGRGRGPPARDAHPRLRLDPRHTALLARRHPYYSARHGVAVALARQHPAKPIAA